MMEEMGITKKPLVTTTTGDAQVIDPQTAVGNPWRALGINLQGRLAQRAGDVRNKRGGGGERHRQDGSCELRMVANGHLQSVLWDCSIARQPVQRFAEA